ncbi:hypothetical protein Tco_1129209 [Tanacetum coccineum]|uniref:Uncharacterized protein n=1 Tax=Tanacetum coccineum TaxID=301880 RepID=A0ABQ5CMG7_9ASTR
MDTDRLCVYVFPFSVTGVARKWWTNEGSDKITTWSEAVEEEDNKLMDDAESSNEELKESDYGNPRNTDNDSFFKPYLDAQEKDNRYEIKKME